MLRHRNATGLKGSGESYCWAAACSGSTEDGTRHRRVARIGRNDVLPHVSRHVGRAGLVRLELSQDLLARGLVARGVVKAVVWMSS